jgi:hypothetical protein
MTNQERKWAQKFLSLSAPFEPSKQVKRTHAESNIPAPAVDDARTRQLWKLIENGNVDDELARHEIRLVHRSNDEYILTFLLDKLKE